MFIIFIALAIDRSNKTERSLLVKLIVRQYFIFPQVQTFQCNEAEFLNFFKLQAHSHSNTMVKKTIIMNSFKLLTV